MLVVHSQDRRFKHRFKHRFKKSSVTVVLLRTCLGPGSCMGERRRRSQTAM